MSTPSYLRRSLLPILLVGCLAFSSQVLAQATGEMSVLQPLPVGVLLRGQDTGNVIIVLGSESNGQAVDFSRWELSLQDVLDILAIENVPSPENPDILELTAPFLRTTLDTSRLPERSELGLAVTAQQVEDIFSTQLSFDSSVFAVNFQAPEQGSSVRRAETLSPLSVAGLERFTPLPATLSSFSQSFNASSLPTLGDLELSGETELSGGLLGSSYYLRFDENDIPSPENWTLDEARFFLPQADVDYTLGVYEPFWQLDEDFAGLSLIYRNGFEAGEVREASDLLPRDIVGETEPGSVVRLVEANRETVVLSEVLVDSTGIYRFDDVPTADRETRYTVLIYPGGLLSAAPIRRDFSFQSIGGQLPNGAFSVTAAAGVERTFLPENVASTGSSSLPVLGSYGGVEGGVALRYGVLEQLTLGAGAVYDEGLRAYGAGYYAPNNLPLNVAVQGTSPVLVQLLDEDDPETAEDFVLEGRLDYNPLGNLSFEGVASETLQRFGVRYNPTDEIQLRADADSADLGIFGVRVFNYPLGRLQNFADFEISVAAEFRWSFSLRDPDTGLGLRQSGNEAALSTVLSYTAPEVVGGVFIGQGHELRLENEIRYDDLSLVWNPVYTYTSPLRTAAGQPLFGAQLGYAFGDTDSRLNLTGRVGVIEGLYLDAGYQGLFGAATDRLNLGLTSSYNLVAGSFVPASSRSRDQATSGAVIAVFFDRNDNGVRDAGEALYAENLELLLKLAKVDNTVVQLSSNNVTAEVAQVQLAPGTYRLDLDPAGYPLNFSPTRSAYALRVSPGVYTSVQVPLRPSFSRIGVLSDGEGKPIAGARVEAVGEGGKRAFSITSGAGVYYLDGLSFGTYRLQVLGKPTLPAVLTFDEASEPYAELNLMAPAFGAD